MGQYYKAYTRGADGCERVYNPHTAEFMAVHGIASEEEIPDELKSWDFDDPTSYGSLSNGYKLMEHSWVGNGFADGVMESLNGNPLAVAWVGDYANDPDDFKGAYTPKVYGAVWGDGQDSPFPSAPTGCRDGFIVNRSKGVYIDLAKYVEAASFSPSWGGGRDWCIHPLPLLTCIGNGGGGGDYHGACMDMVGAWAMHVIEFAEERPEGCEEIDYGTIAFKEG